MTIQGAAVNDQVNGAEAIHDSGNVVAEVVQCTIQRWVEDQRKDPKLGIKPPE